MTITEALPWLNLMMLPMLGHIVRTENRITRLEAHVGVLLERLGVKS